MFLLPIPAGALAHDVYRRTWARAHAGMGKTRHLYPPMENVQGYNRFNYNILVRTKKPKSLP